MNTRFVCEDLSIVFKIVYPMPRLKPDTIHARKEHILDAAEICFAKSGFHRTTMQAIAREAGISLGAIYVYFDAKEALIEGLAERDRSMLSEDLAKFAEAPDLLRGLQKLGEIYAVERPRHKQILHIEIGAESTRNEEIGEIFRSVDCFCRDGFEKALVRAIKEKRIAPTTDPKVIAQIMSIIGDGMFWRAAVDPDFRAQTVLPAMVDMMATLINPLNMEGNASQQTGQSREPSSESDLNKNAPIAEQCGTSNHEVQP